MKNKKTLPGGVAMLALIASSFAGAAQAADNHPWLLRARGVAVVPDESATITPIGGDVSITTTVVPEVDISYFFTKNIAAELIAATTPHQATAKGTALGDVDLGKVWLLPPTLTLQYHFYPMEGVKPYVGAGVNYTHFYHTSGGAAVINDIDYSDSWGGALQAGVDVDINERWVVNFDVKKVWISPDVKINGGAVSAGVDIDPWIIGIGAGYRF